MEMGNKVALITGASRGIGEAIAVLLAKKGCNVVINYNYNLDLALKVKEKVKRNGVDAMVVKADISNEKEVTEMINEIVSKYGKIDILVNNASIACDDYLENKSVASFKRVVDVNLNGTFIVSKLASRYMTNGSIVNIASNNAFECHRAYSMDYDASKAGVVSLTKNLALSLPNIRVNAVAPGWIKTKPVLEMNPDLIEEEKNNIIMKRFGTPEEVAKVVAFLVSDDASYINGSVIRVDGGVR